MVFKKCDYVIVGAGISGVYCAYRLMQTYPDCTIYLIDKQNYIGGRALVKRFHDINVNMGAGVVRPTDKHLLRLCDELNINVKRHKSSFVSKDTDEERQILYNEFKTVINKNILTIKRKRYNMYQCLLHYFDSEFANRFIANSVYTDYLDADVQKTVMEYPLEEILLKSENTYYSVSWDTLLNRMILPSMNFRLSESVYRIHESASGVYVFTDKDKYICRKVFVCGDMSVKNIQFNKSFSFFDYIGSVPFFRAYGYFKDGHRIEKSIKTNTIFDKMIPINKKVCMVSYCDGEKASHMNTILSNQESNLEYLNRLYKGVLKNGMDDYICMYWEHGIHYYKPHAFYMDVIHDEWSKIIFLGEMVSRNQGFVEGCIESVDSYFD